MTRQPDIRGTVDPSQIFRSATSRDYVNDVATHLLHRIEPGGAPSAKVRLGVVQAFNATAWTATITLSGLDTQVPGIPSLAGYLLEPGDTVLVLQFGASYVIAGTTGRPSTQSVLLRLGAPITLTDGTQVDIPDLSYSFTSPGPDAVWLVDGIVDFKQNGTVNTAIGFCAVDGVMQVGQIIFTSTVANTRITATQSWRVTGLAAGAHTIKMGAYTTAAGSNFTVASNHTSMRVRRDL